MNSIDPPLTFIVVGQVNVGKTSIVRTFTEDAGFGVVRPEEATKDISCKVLQEHARSRDLLKVCDSPGLHFSGEAVDKAFLGSTKTADEPRKVNPHFGIGDLDTAYKTLISDADPDFRKKYKSDREVINYVANSDLVFWVVAIDKKPTKDDKDTALILSRLEKPVIPLMNYTQEEESKEEEWKRLFRGVHFTLWRSFDAHKSPIPAKERLYKQIIQLLEDNPKVKDFEKWKNNRKRVRGNERLKILDSIVNLLLVVANLEHSKSSVTEAEKADTEKSLKVIFINELEELECKCHRKISRTLGFKEEDLNDPGFDWDVDPGWFADTWTNRLRIPPFTWTVLSCEATGTVKVDANDELLCLLLGRVLAVTICFLQRGKAKEDQEQVEKHHKKLSLKKKLKKEFLDHVKLFDGNPTTCDAANDWEEIDEQSFEALRDLIDEELRSREELET